MKKTLLWFCVAGFLLGGTACSDDNHEMNPKPPVTEPNDSGGETAQTENEKINEQVHAYLSEMYLWNYEYKQKMQIPDFKKDYDDFFYDALYNLKENTLDRRQVGLDEQGKPVYRLFSYIEQLPDYAMNARAIPQIEKEASYTFGVTGISPVAIGSSAQDAVIYFCVQGVYPDSPAAQTGLKRGAMICQVNGQPITYDNYQDLFYTLIVPGRAMSIRIAEEVAGEAGEVGMLEHSFSSKLMPSNPILCSGVNETVSGHRIGYLNYASFDAGFDVELFEVFQQFRQKQVTDLILDLRYNGGGHTVSADLIATCIAGKSAQDKVFMKLRYNKERMAKLRKEYVEELFSVKQYANLKGSLEKGFLNLRRVYCLVGAGTASSSELVINALRGIDVEVVLIGERTTGKNVGMEYTEFEEGKHVYRVVPITFQSYNAKNFGDYHQGFVPDFILKETNPFNEEGRFYVHREFMTDSEPLYAKAVELITGVVPMNKARSVAVSALSDRICPLQAPVCPGFDGMLKRFDPSCLLGVCPGGGRLVE